MVGELVEVVREREMWFPAKVGKVIDEFSYIVEYSDQKWEEGGRSEYLHWQIIRPVVQHLPPKNEFHLHLSETERRRENASSSEETNDEHESLVLPRAQRFLGLYCYLLNYKAERCKPRRTRLRRVRTSIPMRRNSRPWLACSSSCRAILVHDFLRTR